MRYFFLLFFRKKTIIFFEGEIMEDSKTLKAIKKRETILNGNLWKSILIIGLPILFYNLCNYLYGIYDMMVVQSANIGEAADIVVLDQIKNMISTFAAAISTGGGILVARIYGERKNNEAKLCANTLFTISLVVALITLVFIPIGVPFLRLLKTDESTISNAMGYYYVQIVILVLTSMNNTFIALEKAKGNTLKLFILNIGVILIKISLSTLFAYGPFENVTITWLAVATLIAQSFLFFSGLFFSFEKNNILRITPKQFNFNKTNTLSIIKLSFPIFAGRFLFSFGKVYVNSTATSVYGKTVVGALGISNTIAGLLSNMINSFEDATSTIISQNYGAKNGKRIQKTYFINMIYILIMSIIGTIVLFTLRYPIALFFAGSDNKEYQQIIVDIFSWECMDIVFMGLNGVGMAVFYGFGKTRVTMALSMSTLFLFRIPTLLILMYVIKMNYVACGVAMFISNFITGVLSLILSLIFIIKLPKNKKYIELF